VLPEVAKILLVEDEKDLRSQIADWFKRDCYLVEQAGDGNTALDLLSASTYDAIVLDWMLPGLDGIGICRDLRARGDRTPVIMLTARSSVEDMERGLDCGADYYLRKPVSLRELSASVRAAIRRGSETTVTETLTACGLSLDPRARQVVRDGFEIKLEPKEFNLLEFLLRNPNRVFSPQAIIERVWPSESMVSPDAVRTCVKSLRAKLGSRGEDSIIKNVRGVGYKLEAKW